MNTHIMKTLGFVGIMALMITMLIACDSAGGTSGDPDSSPPPSTNLYAWGRNTYGQLGIGTETVEGNEVLVNKNAPVQVGDKTWKQVSAGGSYTVAIDSDDHLFAWGSNYAVNSYQDIPVAVVIGGDTTKTWKQVSTGGGLIGASIIGHTMAIDSDDHLFAWGNNTYGQFGNGNTTNSTSPIQIGTQTWKQVSAGGSYTVAIDSDDHLFAWGNNTYGQLGSGNTDDSATRVKVGNKTWTQVSTGNAFTVAIDSAGELYAWGNNTYGQLGDGNSGPNVQSTSPILIGDEDKTWKQVSVGGNTTLGIIQ